MQKREYPLIYSSTLVKDLRGHDQLALLHSFVQFARLALPEARYVFSWDEDRLQDEIEIKSDKE